MPSRRESNRLSNFIYSHWDMSSRSSKHHCRSCSAPASRGVSSTEGYRTRDCLLFSPGLLRRWQNRANARRWSSGPLWQTNYSITMQHGKLTPRFSPSLEHFLIMCVFNEVPASRTPEISFAGLIRHPTGIKMS